MPHLQRKFPLPSSGRVETLGNVSEESTMPSPQQTITDDITTDEVGSRASTPTNLQDADFLEDSDEVESCSSFSLQECIDEFRARRVRRTSGQGRESTNAMPPPQQPSMPSCSTKGRTCAESVEPTTSAADADLINQNRSNKEQERKCKPCQNGFCYCFTSDSGDNGCSAATSARAQQVRHSRRHSRRSECQPPTCAASQQTQLTPTKSKERQCSQAHTNKQSLKSARSIFTATHTQSEPLTAVSRLEEATARDAPLIHIIQELHNNCVISEVRVNKHKIQQSQAADCEPLTATTQFSAPKKAHFQLDFGKQEPSAPPIEEVSTTEDMLDEQTTQETDEKFEEAADNDITYSSLDTSSKSDGSAKRRRQKGAGRLLQKRLSLTSAQLKPHKFGDKPPPKPPRSSIGCPPRKSSVSTFASTTTSVREAEKILDDFLRRRGYQIPGEDKKQWKSEKYDGSSNMKHHKEHEKKVERKSYPFTQPDGRKPSRHKVLPTCPSLSDIERDVNSKKPGNYGKNIRRSAVHDKYEPKEYTIGWSEPKISEMLSYDKNANQKEFRTQGTQVTAPTDIGWQMPPPQMSLDMVDGAERHNLASNVENKNTPVKSHAFGADTQKWTQKLSPWVNKTNGNTHGEANAPPHAGGGFKLKSSLKSSSRAFISNSKKKILRLVTPKKDNKVERARKLKRKAVTSSRTVGVQTTHRNRFAHYEHSAMSQSPPGSYHSPGPVPTSTDTTANNNDGQESDFDFARTVQSPQERKTPRQLPRRLNFPSCGETSSVGITQRATKTYRSFQSDLDHDITLSKMGCLLGNIRAKLEASDDRAVRTFEEIRRREHAATGYDTPDSHCLDKKTRTRVVVHDQHVPDNRMPRTFNKQRHSYHHEHRYDHHHHNRQLDSHGREPIYSEIEEDSIHISGSPHPQYDNAMGTPQDPQALYAKRSDIFLENLCDQEIFVDSQQATAPLAKVDNQTLNLSFASTAHHDVSYELPQSDDVDSIAAGSQLGSVNSIPVHANNQSTPKKDVDTTFTSKHKSNDESKQDMSPEIARCQSLEICRSWQNIPAELTIDTVASKRQKLDEIIEPTITTLDKAEENIALQEKEKRSLVVKTWKHCKRFERALRRSFKKSKSFIKEETQRLTRSFNGHAPNSSFSTINSSFTRSEAAQESLNSSFNLEALFKVNDDTPVTEQLAKAVSICRQLPQLEISTEMVEAERLLLFSTLRTKAVQQQHPLSLVVSPRNLQPRGRLFYIDSLDLPVRVNPSQDLFFNHYYIVAFESNGVITSTQSAECHKDAAIFQDCGIEFVCGMELDREPEVRCNIFMLRLRKVSTLSLEPQKRMTLPNIFSNSSSSSCEEIVSRFRLQASFTMRARDFRPFEYVECESKNTNQICLRASNSCKLPLVPCTKSSNLLGPIHVTGRVEARFPKVSFHGYLNVQDPHTLHSWNRRWCTLDGIYLRVWQDESEESEHQLYSLDLRYNQQIIPLGTVQRELCARPRCFCLESSIRNADETIDSATVFFTADTQEDLSKWLQQLNAALDFISTWIQCN